MAILVYESTLIFTDMAPITYVIFCHHRSFDRMAAINVQHETSFLEANRTKDAARGGTMAGSTEATKWLASEDAKNILTTGDAESAVLQMTYADDSLQSSRVNNSLIGQGMMKKM